MKLKDQKCLKQDESAVVKHGFVKNRKDVKSFWVKLSGRSSEGSLKFVLECVMRFVRVGGCHRSVWLMMIVGVFLRHVVCRRIIVIGMFESGGSSMILGCVVLHTWFSVLEAY